VSIHGYLALLVFFNCEAQNLILNGDDGGDGGGISWLDF